MTEAEFLTSLRKCPFCGPAAAIKYALTRKNVMIGCGSKGSPLYGCAHFTDWDWRGGKYDHPKAIALAAVWNRRAV